MCIYIYIWGGGAGARRGLLQARPEGRRQLPGGRLRSTGTCYYYLRLLFTIMFAVAHYHEC